MNGKKAKMLRRSGKLDKKTKKMYNSLKPDDKHMLSQIYEEISKDGK